MRQPLDEDQPAHTTDVVVMEVLAGARADDHRDRLRLAVLGRWGAAQLPAVTKTAASPWPWRATSGPRCK